MSDQQPLQPDDGRVLRVEGMLDDRFTFARLPGWEGPTPRDPLPEGDGTVEVVLLDESGAEIARVRPVIDFTEIVVETDEPAIAFVRADVPYSDRGRALEVRAKGRTLHREEIPQHPPEVVRVAVAPMDRAPSRPQLTEHGTAPVFEDDDHGRNTRQLIEVSWEVAQSNDAAVAVDVLLAGPDGILHPVAQGLAASPYVLDLTGVQWPELDVVVRVSDGVRSTSRSETVKVHATQPGLVIVSPRPGQVLPPDQPFDLRARVDDPGVSPDAKAAIAWRIDGRAIAQATALATAPVLDPGEHVIEVTYRRDGAEQLQRQVTVEIAQRDAEQERWLRAVRRLT